MNADGSGHRNLTRNRAQDYFPTWSPDGRKIAFSRTRNSSRFHGHPFELWVMNADGSGQRRLTRETWHVPGLPLHGRRATTATPALVAGRAQASLRQPSRRQPRGLRRRRRQRRATQADTQPADDRDPAWSPDGRKIAFISTRDGERAIYVMNADGSQPRSVTRGIRSIGVGFAWSPAQKK